MPGPGTDEPAGMEIRSFHVVFALERRLHRIDRWRLPFPYGVPVRAIAYAATALLVIVVAGRLPLTGALTGVMPAPLRYVLAPAAIGAALARLRVDGRPAHRHLLARLAHQLAPARRSGVRASPAVGTVLRLAEPCVIAPDSSGPRTGRRGSPAPRSCCSATPRRGVSAAGACTSSRPASSRWIARSASRSRPARRSRSAPPPGAA